MKKKTKKFYFFNFYNKIDTNIPTTGIFCFSKRGFKYNKKLISLFKRKRKNRVIYCNTQNFKNLKIYHNIFFYRIKIVQTHQVYQTLQKLFIQSNMLKILNTYTKLRSLSKQRAYI